MRSANLFFISVAFAFGITLAHAQTPAPIIVQAASPAVAPDSASAQSAIKLLEEMKSKNEETLKKQEATLQQLDELQQAADELRIYAKRG